MTEAAGAFMGDLDRKCAGRGERVAAWVEDHLRHSRSTSRELAFRLRAEPRDLTRLLAERTCGSRLEDRLAAYFGWTFVEAVFAPVVPDPLQLLEREVERERAEMAAREARLEALRASRRPAAPGAARAHHPQAGLGHAR